jgi:16S rRNA processing protein RimM
VVPSDLIELGVVRGAFGIKGWVRIVPFAADGAVLDSVRRWWLVRPSGPQMVIVEECRQHGAAIVAKWPQCDSKEAADALRGVAIAVCRSDFPPLAHGEHYVVDVMGLRVVNREGAELGTVSGLRSGRSSSAPQWLEVGENGNLPSGDQSEQTLLIPLNEQYVDEIDSAARLIRVDWQRDW